MLNFDKYCLDIGFLYLFDAEGNFIDEFTMPSKQIRAWPKTGTIKSRFGDDPAGLISSMGGPTITHYRIVEDPISLASLKAYHSKSDRMQEPSAMAHTEVKNKVVLSFHKSIGELRCQPIIELAPYSSNHVGSQKFKTDLHTHITTKHIFKLGNSQTKTKLEILLKDPVTGEKVDATYHATVKIEKIFDGFPELLQEKENITVKNGVYDYEFVNPTIECNVFFKVKPQAAAWNTDSTEGGEYVRESDGYNIKKSVAAFTYRN